MPKLNFSISLQLLKEGFTKGINEAKGALRGLATRVALLTNLFGLGSNVILSFFEALKRTARELNQARVILKNVTESLGEFADTERYIVKLGNEFGQSINVLERSFAKFYATTKAAGGTMEQTREVFRGMVSVISSFGLSTADAQLAFMAIEQMMGKGTISSEELRRQLGEKIPVAMQAMANAAKKIYGTDGSIASLQKLLQQGALNSAQIMPTFIKEMVALSGTPDVDNLETSFNRLGNTLRQITDEWDIVGKFKALVDGVVAALNFLRDHTIMILSSIAAFALAKSNAVRGVFTAKAEAIKQAAGVAEEAMNAERAAMARLKKAKDDFAKADKKLLQKKQVEAAPTAKQAETIKKHTETLRALAAANQNYATRKADLESKIQAVEAKINERKERAHRRYTEARLAAEQKVHQATERLNEATAATQEAKQQLAATKTQSVWSLAFAKIKVGLVALRAQFAAAFSATIFGAAIAAIGWIIEKVVELVRQLGAVKRFAAELKNNMDVAVANDPTIRNINSLLRILSKQGATQEEINDALKRASELTGQEVASKEKAVELLKKQKDLETARVRLKEAQRKRDEANEKIIPLERAREERKKNGSTFDIWNSFAGYRLYRAASSYRDNKELDNARKEAAVADKAISDIYKQHPRLEINENAQLTSTKEDKLAALESQLTENQNRANKDYDNGLITRLDQINAQVAAVDEYIDGLRKALGDEFYNSEKLNYAKNLKNKLNAEREALTGFRTPKEKQETDEQRINREYEEGMLKLNNLAEAGQIKEQELNERREELAKTYVEAGAELKGRGVTSMKYYAEAISAIAPELTEFEQAVKEYGEGLGKLNAQANNQTISNEDYRRAQADLLNSVIERIGTLSSLSDVEREQLRAYMQQRSDMIAPIAPPSRDTRRDYKKTESEITAEQLASVEKYINDIEQAQKSGLIGAEEILATYRQQASTLKELLYIKELEEDIDKLKQERWAKSYQSIKGVASAARHAADSIKKLGDAIDDVDASPLEKLFSIFEMITQMIEGVMSLVNAFKALNSVMNALNAAQQAQQAATQTAASLGTMALGAATSLPIGILPLLGNMLKGVAGFSTGGLVQTGSPFGDRTLIRVNKGERVLNTEQQRWLEGLSRGLVRNDQVAQSTRVYGEFRLQGRDLVATIDNYSRASKR